MRARISDSQKVFQPAQADDGLDDDRAVRAVHLLQRSTCWGKAQFSSQGL